MEDIRLTLSEAIQLITTCIKLELVRRNVTMEVLNASSISDRTAFTRAIVHNVQQKILENPNWRAKNLPGSIDKFYDLLFLALSYDVTIQLLDKLSQFFLKLAILFPITRFDCRISLTHSFICEIAQLQNLLHS